MAGPEPLRFFLPSGRKDTDAWGVRCACASHRNSGLGCFGILPFRMASERSLPITTAVKDIFDRRYDNDKFIADMVFALAIVHHLVFSQGYGLDSIVETFSSYTKKWLLVEFIDDNDTFVKEHITETHDFYRLDLFCELLNKHFREVEKLPSTSENRTLLLCCR